MWCSSMWYDDVFVMFFSCKNLFSIFIIWEVCEDWKVQSCLNLKESFEKFNQTLVTNSLNVKLFAAQKCTKTMRRNLNIPFVSFCFSHCKSFPRFIHIFLIKSHEIKMNLISCLKLEAGRFQCTCHINTHMSLAHPSQLSVFFCSIRKRQKQLESLIKKLARCSSLIPSALKLNFVSFRKFIN